MSFNQRFFQVQSSGKTEVIGANVLAAILSEQESQSVYFIRQENISRLDGHQLHCAWNQ